MYTTNIVKNLCVDHDEDLQRLFLSSWIKGLIRETVLLHTHCEEVHVSAALTTASLDPALDTCGTLLFGSHCNVPHCWDTFISFLWILPPRRPSAYFKLFFKKYLYLLKNVISRYVQKIINEIIKLKMVVILPPFS